VFLRRRDGRQEKRRRDCSNEVHATMVKHQAVVDNRPT
jgi:hypothetical protein